MAELNIFQVIGKDPSKGYDANEVVTALKKKRSQMANVKPELAKWASQVLKDIEADPKVIDRHARAYGEVARKQREEREKELRERGKMLVTGGLISKEQLDVLENAFKTYFTRDEILRILGAREKAKRTFTWSPPPGYDSIPEVDSTTMGNIQRDLDKLRKKSLYDVLSLPQNTTAAAINAAIDREYNRGSMMSVSNPEKVPLTNLIGHCRTQLADPDKRRSYDKSVGNTAFAPVRDAIATIAKGSTRVIDGTQLAQMLQTCIGGGMSRGEAEYKIYHEAEDLGVTVIETVTGGGDIRRMCRYCGAVPADKATTCPNCGMPLAVTCPKCGRTSTDPAENYCPGADPKKGCNFYLLGMAAARDHAQQARQALAAGDLANARMLLDQATQEWPGMKELSAVRHDIDRVKGNADKVRGDIQALIADRNFYAALAMLPKLAGADAALERQVRDKVAAADSLVTRAAAERDATRRIDLYMQALDLAADCAKATAGLAASPPQPPQGLAATATGSVVKVTWTAVTSGFVKVTVVRKAGSAPTSHTDGTVVARDVSSTTVTDNSPDHGETYFYGAYCSCGNTRSTLAVAPIPALVADDIDPSQNVLSVTATSVTVTCKLPPHATGLAVTAPGGATTKTAGPTVTVSNLTADRTYRYSIATVYRDATGREHLSAGVAVDLTPTAPPQPVALNLSDAPTSARLQWAAPPAGQTVVIFWSQGKPFEQHRGDMLTMNAMSQQRLSVAGNACTVNKDFSGVRYFLPVTVKGTIGVAGDAVAVRSLVKPAGVKVNRSANSIDVSWSWDKLERVRVTLVTSHQQSQDIANDGNNLPRCSFALPEGAQTARVDVCSIVDGVCSEADSHTIVLRQLRISYKSLKQKGLIFLKSNDFVATLQTDAPLPCNLNVYFGINRPPLNVGSLAPDARISATEVTPGKPVSISFVVPGARNAKQVFILLQPADDNGNVTVQPASQKAQPMTFTEWLANLF